MANPQIQDGHTDIANDLLEAIIKTPMSDYEHRVFWLIVRKTYGFRKKSDWISHSQIVDATGINKQNVSRTIKKLSAKNMITKHDKRLSIQKDYELWKLSKKITKSNLNRLRKLSKEITDVIQTDDRSNPGRALQNKKQLIQKKILQKNSPKRCFSDDSIEVKLSNYLLNRIRVNNPEFKQPNIGKWAEHIGYMLRIDTRNPEKIKEVIGWCTQDSFWFRNILSTQKLREKFDQLVMNMKGRKNESFNYQRDYTEEELQEREKARQRFYS